MEPAVSRRYSTNNSMLAQQPSQGRDLRAGCNVVKTKLIVPGADRFSCQAEAIARATLTAMT